MKKHESRAFDKYFRDLREITIPSINQYFSDWDIIIYLDSFLVFPMSQREHPTRNQVLDFIKQHRNNPRITIYLYYMPDLALDDQHIGTSGTMVRFLPFFENYKTVWCVDVDLHPTYFKHMSQEVHKFLNSKYQMYLGLNTYGYTWKSRMPNPNNKYALVAGTLISKVNFPSYLLDNFMNKLKKNSNKNNPQNWNKLIEGAKQDPRRWKNGMEKFPYGGDEWFLNTVIYNYIQKNRIPVLVEFRLNPEGLITYLRYNSPPFKKLIESRLTEYDKMRKLEKEIWINQTPQNWAEYKKITLDFTDWLLANLPISYNSMSQKERAYINSIKLMNENMKKSNNYYFIIPSNNYNQNRNQNQNQNRNQNQNQKIKLFREHSDPN